MYQPESNVGAPAVRLDRVDDEVTVDVGERREPEDRAGPQVQFRLGRTGRQQPERRRAPAGQQQPGPVDVSIELDVARRHELHESPIEAGQDTAGAGDGCRPGRCRTR